MRAKVDDLGFFLVELLVCAKCTQLLSPNLGHTLVSILSFGEVLTTAADTPMKFERLTLVCLSSVVSCLCHNLCSV